jgi:hypothetical protein
MTSPIECKLSVLIRKIRVYLLSRISQCIVKNVGMKRLRKAPQIVTEKDHAHELPAT